MTEVRCPYCGESAELTQAGEIGFEEWTCANEACEMHGRVIKRTPWRSRAHAR